MVVQESVVESEFSVESRLVLHTPANNCPTAAATVPTVPMVVTVAQFLSGSTNKTQTSCSLSTGTLLVAKAGTAECTETPATVVKEETVVSAALGKSSLVPRHLIFHANS
jgi:hypothetical protein